MAGEASAPAPAGTNPRTIVFLLTAIVVSTVIIVLWERHPEVLQWFVYETADPTEKTVSIVMFFVACALFGYMSSICMARVVTSAADREARKQR
eukprot:tig00000498_g1629.t1